jgi:putative hydrolase of the HAD superfamily
MEKQTILFDLDDTLIQCNKYFMIVIEQFAEQMLQWFPSVNKEAIMQKQLEIDILAIEEHGLSSERFPESFVRTYEHFSQEVSRPVDPDEVEQLRNLGLRVFEMEVEALPNMFETLELLKQEGHDLYLYTGGDEENQRRKITQLELATFFEHRIFISEHKDTSTLSNILKTIKADPQITWMIGNSLRTDIMPALELGINTVYIPAENEWGYNIVEVDMEPKRAYLTLKSIKDLPEIIEHHASANNR